MEAWLEYVGGDDDEAKRKVREVLDVDDLSDPWLLVDAACGQEKYYQDLWEDAAPYLRGYVVYLGESYDIWKDEFEGGMRISQFSGWLQFSDGTTALQP